MEAKLFIVGDDTIWSIVDSFSKALEIMYWYETLKLHVSIKDARTNRVIIQR